MYSISVKHPWGMSLGAWLCLSFVIGLSISVSAATSVGESSVSKNFDEAKNGHGTARERAICALANISVREESDYNVCDELIGIVAKTDDIFVRIAAIETLGKLQTNVTKDDKALTKYRDPFLNILTRKDEPNMVKKTVILVFKETLRKTRLQDQDRVYPEIVKLALSRGEDPVRLAAIDVIGTFGATDGIDTLANVLNAQESRVKESAAKGIFHYLNANSSATINPGAVNKLVDMLKDKAVVFNLRIAVMKTLARLIRDGNVGAKMNAFDIILNAPKTALGVVDPDADTVVLAAIESLGIIGSADAIKPIIDTYLPYFDEKQPEKPKDIPVRKAIMEALALSLQRQAELKTPDSTTVHKLAVTLISVLDKDPSIPVKSCAIYALRYLHKKGFHAEHKEAVDAMLGLLSKDATQKNMELKGALLQALEAITGENFDIDMRCWNTWFDKTYGAGGASKVRTPKKDN
ncbi:MAG: HEAT repeat domain-containing protein [Planctomycetota bacterium]